MKNKPIIVLKQHSSEEFYRESFNPDKYIDDFEIQERENQSRKTNPVTILITTGVLTSLTLSGLIARNYICEKIIPQAYQVLYGQY